MGRRRTAEDMFLVYLRKRRTQGTSPVRRPSSRVSFVRMTPLPLPGRKQGRLNQCPASPNCVCSQDPDPAHQIVPLAFTGTADDAWGRLKTVVAGRPRARIVEESADYLRAEFRSRVFRFVDDVEFVMDEPNHVIQVRSASRVGYSDLGVNRRRIEALRAAFTGA
jgi:uncharacterized protein (DUF1499 family)